MNAAALERVARMRETAAPLYDPLFDALDEDTRARVEQRACSSLASYQRGGETILPVEVRWAVGQRSASAREGSSS